MTSAWDLYVFRETRRRIDAGRLIDGLVEDFRARRTADALVRAGEIESALADASAPAALAATALTDALAATLVGAPECDDAQVVRLARAIAGAGELVIVPPESFSYYGLHPRDLIDRVAAPPLDGIQRAAVIGLRSIGTTLSAVVCAALRARGGSVERRTVRPQGQAYARLLRFGPSQARWVKRHIERGSDFIVVDEGPGLSGSTLLSVAEALTDAGTARERILIVCTRDFDPSTLLAHEAARRWSALRISAVTCAARIPSGFEVMPAGSWRRHFLAADARWPGCWPWLERSKALSADGRTLLKFEGLGRHGADAHMRAAMTADAGFAPRVRGAVEGRVAYDVILGSPTRGARLDERTIDRLADYCAWRACCVPSGGTVTTLAQMVRKNAAVALGVDLCIPIEVARPIIADAHMMPYEWVETPGGRLFKTDAAAHGDDHLFPGPTDAAWDIAGAIVEWRMPRGAIDRFIRRYFARSGDPVRERLPAWLAAYALHRLAWTELAAFSVDIPIERARLVREADARRRWLRVAARLGLLGRAGRTLADAPGSRSASR